MINTCSLSYCWNRGTLQTVLTALTAGVLRHSTQDLLRKELTDVSPQVSALLGLIGNGKVTRIKPPRGSDLSVETRQTNVAWTSLGPLEIKGNIFDIKSWLNTIELCQNP